MIIHPHRGVRAPDRSPRLAMASGCTVIKSSSILCSIDNCETATHHAFGLKLRHEVRRTSTRCGGDACGRRIAAGKFVVVQNPISAVASHISDWNHALSCGRMEACIERESLLSFQLVSSGRASGIEQQVPALLGDRTWHDDEQMLFE